MRVENIFKRDIFRSINGVVKADQLDASSVWQELDEFVVTKELDKHLRTFFSRYCDALKEGGASGASDSIGVWVSGFFGSGKSHFIKVLSYLLANREHEHEGEVKRAVDFFEGKIADAMFLGDIKQAVASDTDVILFNVDSKADNRAGRDALLAVFIRVLNEMQGYSGDHPHVAHMERYLERKGKTREFRQAFQSAAGASWLAERDAYDFHRDEIVAALGHTLGQSQESCERLVDGAEESFALTPENFAKWTKAYLDSRGPRHRLIFLADEVGQFIGSDTHLMLNLQTIAEELGTVCGGRAWIVVTSQEDIDAVLGDLKASKANDFSKIQGRFTTRLSLSSANVDEVIQQRLLAKREEAGPELEAVFASKGDIIKNQLTFKNVGMTLRPYTDAEDFRRNYPFAPYQFKLLQKVFESIRKVGATGLHLARGERSLLDAFQSAAKALASEEVNVLVPLYRFYPSIESFLDTAVKKTIDQARDNASLEPFDAYMLEVLFLIRYVEEMRGNIDNLVTLCIDEIDADRLSLRRRIEASLQRLEGETLISRSGDVYQFLTNEERDIGREIKGVELGSGEDVKLLAELIFDDVLKGQRKHRYAANKMDFIYNRVCDAYPIGSRTDGGLLVSVVSPLSDDYATYAHMKCILESTKDDGHILIHVGDNATLGRELRAYLKTDKYLRTRDDGTLSPTTRRVHRDLADDNRQRRERLTHLLEDMLREAAYFVAGQRFQPKSGAPLAALDEALEYLIENTFTKMSYLQALHDSPLKEIQAVLRSDDIAQQRLDMELPEGSPQAISDLRDYIELATKTSKQIVLHDVVTGRYGRRPYGWPEQEVILLLARLHVAGEIAFVSGGAPIPRDKVYEAITTSSKWRRITVVQRATAKPEDVKKARQLGKDVFSEMGPDAEDALYGFLHKKLERWLTSLGRFKVLADSGKYPGRQEIDDGLTLVKTLLALDESNRFLARFLERKEDLITVAESFHDLAHFYEHQRPTWEKLQSAVQAFRLNQAELEQDAEAAPALHRMEAILAARSPYELVKETEGLISTVSKVNESLLKAAGLEAGASLDAQIRAVRKDLSDAEADAALMAAALGPLERLREKVAGLKSLAHVSQVAVQAVSLKDAALQGIQDFLRKKAREAGGGKAGPTKVKAVSVVRPAALSAGKYLETEDDITKFISALHKALEAAIQQGERIEIR